jgi:hypothetical protein
MLRVEALGTARGGDLPIGGTATRATSRENERVWPEKYIPAIKFSAH